jgi:hypothetical protein
MFKNILFAFLFFLSFTSFSQNTGIVIGEVNNGVYQFKDCQESLSKAIEWTFKDGTKVSEMSITQMGNDYYILATCLNQGRKRIAAIDLDLVGIEFVLKEDAFFKMCSAVACENCRFFFESNKIVACKCEETGTISNHCHYKSSAATSFYANFQRSLRMNQEKH